MSTQYLLPCECGQSVPIGTSQAGQHVTCACGRKLAVPSLRAIRQLPTSQADAVTAPPRSWNATRGAMFAVGAAMLIVGTIIAGHSWWMYSQLATIRPSNEQFDQSLAAIENMTASEVLETWEFAKDHGLEKTGTSVFAIWGGVAKEKFHAFLAGLAVAIVGAVIATISVVRRR